MVTRITNSLDQINTFIGKGTSWLTLLLVIVIILDVCLRYIFSITSSASFELEWHLFALIFLLSAGWTLKEDQHVRVDVFYQKFSDKQKAWVNLLGVIFLLLPLCVIGASEGFQFAANAWKLDETSPDPGGLPARYIIKGAIPVGFILLGLQGVSLALRSLQTILKDA